MINPICLPPRDLRKRTTHCTQQGQRCCHRQPNLSAWPGLVAPRPSSLLRPWVPPPPPSRSAHRPGCQSAPPAQPRPRARHCREVRRPEVSSQADVALAPWPVGRRRDSPRRAWESRAREPVSLHPESFLGREVARCFPAAVKRGGGRSGRAPWRRACCPSPGRWWRPCSWGSRYWALGLPRRGLCTMSLPSSLGRRPGAPWRPSGTSTPTSRRTSSCCGKVSACRPSLLFAPPGVPTPPSSCYPLSCISQPWGSPFLHHPWQLSLSPVLSTPDPDPITARFDHKPPNLRNAPISLHPKPVASTWCIFTCLTKFFLIPKSWFLASAFVFPSFVQCSASFVWKRRNMTVSYETYTHCLYHLLSSFSLPFVKIHVSLKALCLPEDQTHHSAHKHFLLLTTDLILKLQT